MFDSLSTWTACVPSLPVLGLTHATFGPLPAAVGSCMP
jgi:hypothetical protein